MSKTGRNEPCPCGSGKKFKKCCIDEGDTYPPLLSFSAGTGSDYIELTRKYDTVELLKILAVMQLQPENHGKNVRMDELVVSALNTFNTGEKAVNIDLLQADFNKYCGYNPHEDPAEDFFTENILFFNGNNIVYPGTFVEGKEIVQLQLDTLQSLEELSGKPIYDIGCGLIFLFYIHHNIACKMGQSYRMEQAESGQELFLPKRELLEEQVRFIEFTPERIADICAGLSVPKSMVDQFVFSMPKDKIKLNNPDENPMFRKPFIFLDGRYILVMPSGQLSCINDFILSKLREYNVFDRFRKRYAQLAMSKANTRFRSMRWKPLQYKFPARKDADQLLYQEMLYHFDSDKVGYMMLLSPPSAGFGPAAEKVMDNMQQKLRNRITSTVAQIREGLPGFKVFFVLVTTKFEIFQSFRYSPAAFEAADRSLAMSFKELHVLRANWELDHLSLWKYAGHFAQTQNDIFFMPVNTHLSIYKWYKDHHEWFFHSDKAPSNMMFFEFEIEGGVNRSAKRKEDIQGIPFPLASGEVVHIPSHKSEEYLPVYLDDNFVHGHFRNCLLAYSCPIWVQSDQQRDFTASVYMNAILYWLNFCFPWLQGWMSRFGARPIVITLVMDEAMYAPENWDVDHQEKPFQFRREVLAEQRAVELHIQPELITYLISSGNGGEKFLMKELIDLLGGLLEKLELGSGLNNEELDGILNESMPLGNQKMILITDASPNPKLADIDVDPPRFVQDAEVSYILHHQVSWLGYNKPIPEKIGSAKDKIKLFNDLVKVHFGKIIEMIHRFPTVGLLVHLMERHESVIQTREKSKLAFPTLEACYGAYYDVFKEFSKRESAAVTASLAIRSLIEFTACEKSTGTQLPNDDDTDMMLALISELINYGALSDMVHYGIFDPEMGLLPSGRIGIEQTFSDTSLSAFRTEIHLEEVDEYRNSFDRYFIQRTKKEKAKPGDDPYYDRVDEVFMEEWGVTIWDLQGASEFLCLEMFHRLGSSVAVMSEADLLKIFRGNRPGGELQAQKILDLLTFRTRNGVLNVNPKELHEAFPWRYNRRESYMLRPLIRKEVDEEVMYVISARHVVTATENMLSRFLDGTLKVRKEQFKLINLLAERNHIKGKNFRDGVSKWLSANTKMKVFDFEVKIKPHGFFNADEDKGDVDILCLDHFERKIIAIECKNTSQAKIAYDMHLEICSYIGMDGKPGMIQKHVMRDAWLKANLDQVMAKLELEGEFTVESMVLTKHVLPTKFIKDTAIPVYSYSELKRGDIFAIAGNEKVTRYS